MVENSEIILDDGHVILTESMLEKLKYTVENDTFLTRNVDKLSTNIQWFDFRTILDDIVGHCNIKIKYLPEADNSYGIDVDYLLQLRDKYQEIMLQDHDVISSYIIDNNSQGFAQLIDTIYQLDLETKKYYMTCNLIDAKKDCLINMKYFMSEEDINKFNTQYSEAIQKKDVAKMQQMLEEVQQNILGEWERYFEDLDDMTDEHFCFLGHSTHSTVYDESFRSKYVSCSLYNQDVNDTFHGRFGFIMPASNIVGAKSEDMNVNNYANNQENMLHYSVIKKIDHPQRLIDECLQFEKNNEEEGIVRNVYSEVIEDGFHPLAIFCFTNGAKNLDRAYQRAYELQKSFPGLKVRSYDIMKRKTGRKLDKMKLDLVNHLKHVFTKTTYNVTHENLFRYDYFFDEFRKLKEQGEYSEEDIEKIFRKNLQLLSYMDNLPEDVFSGNYSEDEVKYILGKNVRYNIDYILSHQGEVRGFSLNNLKELLPYKDRLNDYYDGLSEFVELASNMEVTDDDIHEIQKKGPITFHAILKYYADKLLPILQDTEEQMKYKLSKDKKQYSKLVKEKKFRTNMEREYQLYSDIYFNSWTAIIIKRDYQEVCADIESNQKGQEHIEEQYRKLQAQLSKLLREREELSSSQYEDSSEYHDSFKKIATIEKEIEVLNKHPLIYRRKIKDSMTRVNSIKLAQKEEKKAYDTSRKSAVSRVDTNIRMVQSNMEFVKESHKQKQVEHEMLQTQLQNVQLKIYETFHCHSVTDMDTMIKKAEGIVQDYDHLNSFYLSRVSHEIEVMNGQIYEQERMLHEIQGQKQTMSAHVSQNHK